MKNMSLITFCLLLLLSGVFLEEKQRNLKKAQSIFDAAASKGEKDISHSINTREEKLDEEKKKKKLKRRRNKSKSFKLNKKNQMMVKGKDVKKNEIGKNMKKMRNKKYKKIEKKM